MRNDLPQRKPFRMFFLGKDMPVATNIVWKMAAIYF